MAPILDGPFLPFKWYSCINDNMKSAVFTKFLPLPAIKAFYWLYSTVTGFLTRVHHHMIRQRHCTAHDFHIDIEPNGVIIMPPTMPPAGLPLPAGQGGGLLTGAWRIYTHFRALEVYLFIIPQSTNDITNQRINQQTTSTTRKTKRSCRGWRRPVRTWRPWPSWKSPNRTRTGGGFCGWR